MTSSSFLAKFIENEVLGIQMKFETKLENYTISKSYWADKKISLPQQKHFVRTTEHFYYIN